MLGLATFWNPSLPPELFFGVFANAFVLIPVQLGYLYYLARSGTTLGGRLKASLCTANQSPGPAISYGFPRSWCQLQLSSQRLSRSPVGSKLSLVSASSPSTKRRGFGDCMGRSICEHLAHRHLRSHSRRALFPRVSAPKNAKPVRAPKARCAQLTFLHLPFPHAVDDSGPHIGHSAAHLHNHQDAQCPPRHNCALPRQFGKLLRFRVEACWEPVNVRVWIFNDADDA